MKRIVSLLFAILMMIPLCACGAHTITPSYDGVVEFEDGSLSCTADLSADGDAVKLTITSPPHLKGLCYNYHDGELHTALDGLDCVTPPENLPATAVPSLLFALFTTADEARFQGEDGGVDTFILHTRGGDMTVTARDGALRTLSFGNRSVRFE